jgi:LPXTG-motif cell wall-anchored protein
VSTAEGNAALDARSGELLQQLEVCTGDSIDDLACRKLDRRQIELVEAQGWIPDASGHLHFAWTLRLDVATSQIGAIRLVDSYEVGGIEMTDVEIVPPDDLELLAAGGEDRPGGVSRSFTWAEARRPPGPRVVTASWPPPEMPWLAIAGAALLLLALGLLVRFRKRRP